MESFENMDIEPPKSSNKNQWYLAASKPRQEIRAIENLSNQGIEAFSPMYQVEKIKAGKKVIVTEVMFTGYVFINLSPEDGLWHKVKSTRGIRDWVRFAGNIAKLPNQLIEKLIQLEKSENKQLVKKCFNQGDLVNILSGPLQGLKGVYQVSSGEERSIILINFLGNTNRLEVANDQLDVES